MRDPHAGVSCVLTVLYWCSHKSACDEMITLHEIKYTHRHAHAQVQVKTGNPDKVHGLYLCQFPAEGDISWQFVKWCHWRELGQGYKPSPQVLKTAHESIIIQNKKLKKKKDHIDFNVF